MTAFVFFVQKCLDNKGWPIHDLIPVEEVFALKTFNSASWCTLQGRFDTEKTFCLTGISVRHIREMEKDRIPIDEATAKVLGEDLSIGYNVFL